MSNNEFHGVAVVKSESSDLWFTYCPGCSSEVRRQCLHSDEKVPQFLAPYGLKQIRSKFSGQASGQNAVAVSRKATSTQKEAARSFYPKSGTIQHKIYELITEHGGLTDEQIEQMLHLKHQSASAARNVLMNKGWVINSGRTRRNQNGNRAIIWIPNPERGV